MEEVQEMYDGLKDIEPSLKRKMSTMEESSNQILQNVSDENIQYFRKSYFFESNSQFPQFIFNTLKIINQKETYSKYDVQFVKLALLTFLTISFRRKNRSKGFIA